jgi:hypothetical protein
MATRSRSRIQSDSTLIVKHDGLLWKSAAGGTVSFEAFLSAKARLTQIMDDQSWNPWNRESHDQELSRLEEVLDQWTRAEPGFRPLTDQEFEQRCEQRRTQREAEQAEQARQREARKKLYNPAREAARLELLENESLIRHKQTELAELRDGTRFPSMDSRRRTEEITTLERSLDDRLARVVRLRDQVGDVETVVDANGALPGERRETALSMFRTWRYCEVTRLRKRLDTARTTLKTTDDKAAKSKIRTQISLDGCRLEALLAVPRPTADQMCADYPHPVAWDCWSTTGGMAFYAGPCPRWPGWAARVRKAREILMSAPSPAVPAAPRAQPLAVIPSGLPLTELMARLAEIQAAHPDARATRGRANRWEVWPAEDAAERTPSRAASPPL